MKDTERDSCGFVLVADTVLPQGDHFGVFENAGKLSAGYSALSSHSQPPLRLNLLLCLQAGG